MSESRCPSNAHGAHSKNVCTCARTRRAHLIRRTCTKTNIIFNVVHTTCTKRAQEKRTQVGVQRARRVQALHSFTFKRKVPAWDEQVFKGNGLES
jgi:hypothetical protein